MGGIETIWTECMACKALNIYYLMSLCGKSLLNLEFLREPDFKKKKKAVDFLPQVTNFNF